MPDNYAPRAKVQRVCSILGAQLTALESLWERHVGSGDSTFKNLPIYGDFSVMKAWPAASTNVNGDDVAED